MSVLAVITPSFGPDADLFADLHRSVLEHTSEDTVHYVIVPDAHQPVFDRYAGSRCRIWPESQLLPRRYRRLRRPGLWINLKRPWPPVRGWVMQQALKIAATAQAEADAVLIADSDVVLVRPTSSPPFIIDGRLGLYRVDDAVHEGMERHVRWHNVAHRLLGIDPPTALPLADYVSSLNFWDPAVVRAMQERIAKVTGRHWMDAFTSQLHISEFILYGVFVERVHATDQPWPKVDPEFCHNYWAETPLDVEAAQRFAEELPHQAIGMMISAKSHTVPEARAAALRRSAEVVAGNGSSIER